MIILAKSILTEAIIAVEGVSDKRRINSRTDLLKSKNCIKESGDSDPQHKRYIFVSQLVPLYNSKKKFDILLGCEELSLPSVDIFGSVPWN